MIYSELHKQHLTLWLPAIFLFATAALGFYFMPLMPLSTIYSTFLLIFLTLTMMAVTFLFYYKYALINCHFQFDEEKLTWELTQTSFIYPTQKQETNWDNIAQIKRIDDKYHTTYYFTWKNPAFTIFLQQPFVEIEKDSIWQALLSHATKNNIPIHNTFYDNTPPPKETGVLLFLVIMCIFADVAWYLHPEIGYDRIVVILLINLIALYLGVKWIKNRKK